ncbi:MAG: hypothetical protein LW750_08390 [Bacteroidetes bacterium]|jgi:hypothetical protein|nr:hypothetical protein [Bacteroidota bacterium]
MKYTIITSVFVFSAFLLACVDEREKASSNDSAKCAPDEVNPNGTAELAVIMRGLADHSEAMKTAIQKGEALPLQPEILERLKTADRTDKNIDVQVYNSHADAYLAQMSQLYGAAQEERPKYFNATIDACISCHENFCHGPIKRIRKLYLSVN